MKNLKSIIRNAVLILVPVLMLIFMSQAYLAVKENIGGSSAFTSGYQLISTEGNAACTLNAVCTCFAIIFTVALIVSGVLGILCDTKVIKGKTIGKVLNVVNYVCLILLSLVTLLSLIAISIEMTGTALGIVDQVVGWAAVVNFVLPVITLLCYFVSKLRVFNK